MGPAEMAESGQFIYGQLFHIMRLDMRENLLQLLRPLQTDSGTPVLCHKAVLIGQAEKAEQKLLPVQLLSLSPFFPPFQRTWRKPLRAVGILHAGKKLLQAGKKLSVSGLSRMDHRHKGIFSCLYRGDIADGTGIRDLPSQQIQMKDQTVGDHFRSGKRMGGMKHIRGDQQDIILLNGKAFKADIVSDASLFDPGRFHFLVPVKRQLPVGIRRDAAVTADGHQDVSVGFFSVGPGLFFFHI